MRNRINRLCLPHFVWTIIYFFGFIIFDLSNDIELGGTVLKQLIAGHTINKAMWFQIDLIILSIILYFLLCLENSKKKEVLVITIIAGSFIIQYTGLNYIFLQVFQIGAHIHWDGCLK